MKASFSRQLYKWYDMHKRQHPWLGSKDAYQIWLSEVIMQQTRIGHGTAYFLKFIHRYPTIHHLARAKEQDILKLWEGLGYYSRARNLLATAREVSEKYDGKFPDELPALLSLKGIGNYTAAAILSFAYEQPLAVVDGNVLRILARIFGIKAPVDSNEGRKKLEALAQELLDKKSPSKYNQAIMDFGALLCTPRSPSCDKCPFSNTCYAYQHDMIEWLPLKSKKTEKKIRHFNFIVFTDGKHTWIEKRTGKDIWMNLYQFPLIETKKAYTPKKILQTEGFIKMIKSKTITFDSLQRCSQQLTHQTIKAAFFTAFLADANGVLPAHYIRVTKTSLKKYTFPGVIRDYLKEIPIFKVEFT